MPLTRLGLEAKLYRNAGTYEAPELVEVDNVKDLTLNLEKNTADVTTRGSGGWRQMVAVLRDGTIDFGMLYKPSDANFQAIRDAFLADDLDDQSIEFFVMSTDVDDADSEGLRATFMVEKFTANQPLEEAQMFDVTIRPTVAAHNPAWVTGGAYGAYD
jgi:predicted secreted protein